MKVTVLEHLQKNAASYVSGEEISRALDLSRTTVWKYIRALRAEGYQIEARPRLGYRLRGVPELVPTEVLAGLTTRFYGRNYHYHRSLASTNDYAKGLARQGAPEGTVVLAEEQSGGRGRLGRSWYSPRGGLWFSVVLRPVLPSARAPEVTFLTAVAGVEALRASLSEIGSPGADEIGIKWPNDLMWGGRKLGGILTELSGEMDRINQLVIGVGLNVNLDLEDFPPLLRGTVTSVQEITGRPVSRSEILWRFLSGLERWYLKWLEDGFAPVLTAWKKYNACIDCMLRVSTPEGELLGRAVDVDPDGALLLDTGAEVRRIVTGDLIVERDGG